MRLKLGRIYSRYLSDGDATYKRRFKWTWRKETCNYKDFYGGHKFEEKREEEEAILNYDLFLANIFFNKIEEYVITWKNVLASLLHVFFSF